MLKNNSHLTFKSTTYKKDEIKKLKLNFNVFSKLFKKKPSFKLKILKFRICYNFLSLNFQDFI